MRLLADIMKEIDYFTPNETEAEFYSGVKIENDEDTEKAAEALINKGIKNQVNKTQKDCI